MTPGEAAHLNQLKQGWIDALKGGTTVQQWSAVYATIRTMEAIDFKELVNERQEKM